MITEPIVRPILLDLCAGAGGAGYGYQMAGFRVVGVDIAPQPHNPHEFYQDDALRVLDLLIEGEAWQGYRLGDFTAIHASPVCKAYTNCNLSPKDKHPKQIADLRPLLIASGKPFVIENVMGAKHDLRAHLMLCGTMFGLPMQRHRLFESNMWLYPPRDCIHAIASIGIHGHSVWNSKLEGTRRRNGRRRPDSVPVEVGREAMGIDWMSQKELAQAIPPAYTQWIGQQLMAAMMAA